MQKHRTFIRSLLKLDCGLNSTLQAKESRNIETIISLLKFDFGLNSTLKSKEWKNIEPKSVSSKKFILVQIQHYRPRKAGTSNISLLKIDFGPNSTLKAKKCRIIKQLASENWFWAKLHISSKKMQDHRKFRS